MYLKLKDSALNQIKKISPIPNYYLEKLLFGVKEEELVQDIFEKEGTQGLLTFYYFLEQIKPLFIYCVKDQDRVIAELIPYTKDFKFEKYKIESSYQISRFAYCRNVEGKLIWETPLSPAGVVLEVPFNCNSLNEFPQDLLLILLNAKIICDEKEEKDPIFSTWEFHDLLFHSRSRFGRHDNPFGGLYPFKGKIPSLPAIKPLTNEKIFSLYVPNIEKLKEDDLSFSYVLEERKSKRLKGRPLTAEKLGEFLYRTCRVKTLIQMNFNDEVTSRLYPAGGARYSLEVYVLIHSCQGLEVGLYHYDPQKHALEKLLEPSAKTEELLDSVKQATGKEELPQILFLITARFQRMSWKYQSMAYATILKDVGSVFQTFYLVATAMNLSPCALGGGNSDLFAKTTGINYYEESTVGEFILS